MQPVPGTGWRSLFEPEACRLKFLEPPFSSKILYVLDERVPHSQKRGFVTLLVAVVPSMSQKDIEIKVFFSAKVLRAG
ncbi:hypothetical protein OVW19_27935, partial [Klebsiella pneumoniae]|nr:hypothetical protein [Klebsiella pneumoniae]